jgi:hypothetical protein
MLYCCVNGSFVDANDVDEVVRVFYLSTNAVLISHTNL